MQHNLKKLFLIILFFVFAKFTFSEEAIANENKDQIIQQIISESISSYPGKCACPYQRTSNGSRCGKRSAYSKPGGYEPICFPSDVTDEMINSSSKTSNKTLDKSPDFVGKVIVTDGDTIKKGNIRIRLHGIDAPETRQTCTDSNNEVYPCGGKSTAFLKSLIKNNEVSCEGKDTDRYGRLIAICYVNGMNVNATMVEEGWAIAYRYYSKDYVREEEMAKTERKGIWEGNFIEPYIWRKKN